MAHRIMLDPASPPVRLADPISVTQNLGHERLHSD